MTLPSRPEPTLPTIQTAVMQDGIYQATLLDGTVLWIPNETINVDCAQLESWAVEHNVNL